MSSASERYESRPDLRQRNRISLSSRARSVFGGDGPRILAQLKEAFERKSYSGESFDPWARRIMRRSSKKRDPFKFVEICIRRDLFIDALTEWSKSHPDPADILSVEEFREIDAADLDAYYRGALKVERQLAVIHGELSPIVELAERIGREPALALYAKLLCALGMNDAERIIGGSWWPWIKKPAAFIEAALKNERAKSSSKRGPFA